MHLYVGAIRHKTEEKNLNYTFLLVFLLCLYTLVIYTVFALTLVIITMTSCDKDQLDELLKKGQAVTATLNRIDDINQMDGLIKKGQTDAAKLSQDYCRTELDELLKQGQTIIQNLSHDGPKVRLDEVLNQSRELIKQLNQNDHIVHPVSAKKNSRKSTYKVRSRKRDKPMFVNKSRQIPKPSISTHHETLLHELQDMLSSIGDNFHSENTSASLDWGTRAVYSSEKWKEARPSLISNMLATEHIIPHICQKCKANEAVFKCRECFPMQYICMECDIVVHSTHVFHNRSSMIAGFHMAVAPTTVMKQDPDGRYFHHHDSRLLPMALPVSICQCGEKKYSVGKGRSITVINMKGRYDLSIPRLYCERCQENWVPGLREVQDTGYWPGTINFSTLYDFEVFLSFEDLKMAAPGLSRLAFIRMLDMKTAHYGRSGNLCGDAFYKSFLEWSICRYEVDKICGTQHFKCTACTPLMLPVAVDGNRKLHRFKKAGNSKESGYFDGVFLCKDEDVSLFVDDIRKKVPHAPGKGVCGSAEFAAAKESSRKSSSRLDEEGIEVAVCRHGVLLRALNMFRGEIYAYPLYLHKELCTENVTFFCADIMCKYWPYLIKVCRVCPELRNLLHQKPFLSVMHAKVHGIKCEIKWSGSYQTGAAYTMGEEVEQANSFLSRIAISTKFMSKAGRTDMLTLQCIGWNKIKVQNMCKTLCTRHRKTRQNLEKEKESLEDMKSELAVDNEVIKQWVTEVQEWAHTATSGDNDVPVEP
ncbi:uncharacterized protein LOC130419507 isoform X2 [Triplophysa dalaica]|uniref:uncharacterized protein LOC130419507 isoform X2 n=1 Tax=Triplophysa dalaica TaxID=1582913 RepID=UPI0024DF534F|nr:uncharacterized protein LOC130419507 isoform X2 [Triplophysa dalaica]